MRGSTIVQIFVDTNKKKVNKKLISRIYSCLMSTKKHSTMYVKQKWEKEANITNRRTSRLRWRERRRHVGGPTNWDIA